MRLIKNSQHSDIRYTLAKISYFYKSQTKYTFPELSDQILQKWILICEANLPGLRWQCTGGSSLQYIQPGKEFSRG